MLRFELFSDGLEELFFLFLLLVDLIHIEVRGAFATAADAITRNSELLLATAA